MTASLLLTQQAAISILRLSAARWKLIAYLVASESRSATDQMKTLVPKANYATLKTHQNMAVHPWDISLSICNRSYEYNTQNIANSYGRF